MIKDRILRLQPQAVHRPYLVVPNGAGAGADIPHYHIAARELHPRALNNDAVAGSSLAGDGDVAPADAEEVVVSSRIGIRSIESDHAAHVKHDDPIGLTQCVHKGTGTRFVEIRDVIDFLSSSARSRGPSALGTRESGQIGRRDVRTRDQNGKWQEQGKD